MDVIKKSIHSYRDFVIYTEVVETGGKDEKGRYHQFSLRVFDSPVGEGEHAEPLSIPDWTKIETWRNKLADRIISPKDFEEFARFLGERILPSYARELYKRSLDQLAEGEGLRVRLRLTTDLAFLPWEYALVELHRGEATMGDYWALDSHVSIVRHEAIDRPAPPFRASSATRRVIFAAASPKPYKIYKPLKLKAEQDIIKKELKDVKGVSAEYHPDFAKEEDKTGITEDELQELLMQPADIFSFSGHGIFRHPKQGGPGQGVIVLAESKETAREVEGDILGGMLAEGHVRLVILEACESGEGDCYRQWSSVALALLKGGIPGVVAMQFSVYDDLVKIFSKKLFRYLVAGLNVDEAVAQGRRAMFRQDRKARDWGAPVLYMRNGGGTIFPPVTDEQARLEAERIVEQDATLDQVALRWARRGTLASPEQLALLSQGKEDLHLTPQDAVLLLRSALEYHHSGEEWVKALRDSGKDWLKEVQDLTKISGDTITETYKQLGLDAQILDPPPERVGCLTWAAVRNADPHTAQTAALALLALEGDGAVASLQEQLEKIENLSLFRRRQALLFGTLVEADPEVEKVVRQKLKGTLNQLPVQAWRVGRYFRRDRDEILRLCLGGAFGGAIGLAALRGFFAIFNSRTVGTELAANSYWGFLAALGLVFGILFAGPLSLQSIGAGQGSFSRSPRALWAVLLGGIGFCLANALVSGLTGLGMTLAEFLRFLLTSLLTGFVLSLGLFHQPKAGWRLGLGGWAGRLAVVALLLAILQAPALCEAFMKPSGSYLLDNALWSISAINESSQGIVDAYRVYPFLNNIFNQCIPVDTGQCCFACSAIPLGCACLAQWWSILDAALMGVVMTIAITAGMHFRDTSVSRWRAKLRAKWRGA